MKSSKQDLKELKRTQTNIKKIKKQQKSKNIKKNEIQKFAEKSSLNYSI